MSCLPGLELPPHPGHGYLSQGTQLPKAQRLLHPQLMGFVVGGYGGWLLQVLTVDIHIPGGEGGTGRHEVGRRQGYMNTEDLVLNTEQGVKKLMIYGGVT